MKSIVLRGAAVALAAAFSLYAASCVTTGATHDADGQVPEAEDAPYAQEQEPQDGIPTVAYVAPGIKCELEDALLDGAQVTEDAGASGGRCVTLTSTRDTARLRVTLEPGTYELLAREKATSTAQSVFCVDIDGTAHRVYPSNPPLGVWELTTRVPVYVTVDEPQTVLVTVQADAKTNGTGMRLDYIQLVQIARPEAADPS